MPERLLFITSTRLGDAVLSTGVLSRLIADHPGAEITIVCGPLPAPLFRAVPGLKRIIPIVKRRMTQHWIKLFLDVVPTRWDVFVDLRGVLLLNLVRARTTYRYHRRAQIRHKVEENAGILGVPNVEPCLWIDDRARADADQLLGGARGFWAIGPTAGNPHKEWAMSRFAELARTLTSAGGALAGLPICVFASAAERVRLVPFFAASPGRIIDLAGKTDPVAAAACLERASLYVGNDSGLMHLAAAAGTPTLGLFGTGNPAIYRPWGRRAA